MEVRKQCNLLRLNSDLERIIRYDTPDIRFLELLCAQKTEESPVHIEHRGFDY